MKHPWWHFFFTRTISWGTKTILSPDRPVCDYSEIYCAICKKFHKEEKWREYT